MPDVPSSDEPIKVLLTGCGGGGHGEQILKALRLGRRRYDVLGTDLDPRSTGRALVDRFEVVPPARDPSYVDTILRLARDHGAVAVFHGSEPEMAVFSASRSRFTAAGLYLPVNPPEVLAVCQDKVRTMRFLSDQEFRVPRSAEIQSVADAEAFDALPCVIKPSVGGGGSANVFIAQNRAEFLAFAAHMLTLYPRFMVQEYVGTPDDEYTVGILFGADGALINSIAVRRVISNALSVRMRVPNRSGRTDLGSHLVVSSGVSQGHVARWPLVTVACERIASALKPTAPVNIQCRFVDGHVVPFEINPRFSGTTSIRAMAGYNEPDVLIRRDVLGEAVEAGFAYRETMILRSLVEHEVALGGPGHPSDPTSPSPNRTVIP